MAKKGRKTRKRTIKRRPAAAKRRRVRAKKKRVLKKRPAPKKLKKQKAKAPPKGPQLPAEPVGRVTHYFPKVRAAAVMIQHDRIRAGDVLYFKGHTTRFKQQVASLQINRQPVSEASSGQEVGIQVKSRTREHDLVFNLSS